MPLNSEQTLTLLDRVAMLCTAGVCPGEPVPRRKPKNVYIMVAIQRRSRCPLLQASTLPVDQESRPIRLPGRCPSARDAAMCQSNIGDLKELHLARAYARSGDAASIAGHMGSNSTFDDTVCEFAVEYADQN
jgi:Uncharacterized protein conserved in bacteria (DUF2252)